ncbi:LuxR family transcriptional regulator [Pseudomonas sp. IC_126]|uniref:helix-turn-helix transcriptional regulator n=1 Tax=Pseudomonas sp. IC_126 TaxID=2547400 RepID=UPI0014042E42|nr:LuxR family transcriptional regulator [Pseudomonas sp. IC_126]
MEISTSLHTVNALVGSIYEGALEDPPWQHQLAGLRDAMGATDAFLILRRPSDTGLGITLSADNTPTGWSDAPYFARRLYALDPFVNLPPNQPMLLSELLDGASAPEDEFFRLVLQPYDIAHILGVDLHDPSGPAASLRFTRSHAQPPFGDDEKALCALLVTHFCRALRIHARLGESDTERAIYAGAMSQLAVATFLLDEHQQVVRTNPLADRLLGDGCGLHLRSGRLKLPDERQDARLRQLLAQVTTAQTSGTASLARAMLVETGTRGAPLSLVIRPVPPGQYSQGASVPVLAIFVSDPGQQAESSASLLMELFQLTPAEARLSVLLANGASVEEASTELHISVHTTRAHLRSIFSKLGVTRQPQLVHLVLKSVASLG